MSDPSRLELYQRAEVLGRMADQLARQLEVERQANDELRELLGEAPRTLVTRVRGPARALPFIFAAAGGILLVTSVSALALRARPVPLVTAPLPPLAAAPLPAPVMVRSLSVSPPPSPLVPQTPAWEIPIKDQAIRAAPDLEKSSSYSDGLRACLPITTAARARCYLEATAGQASGEHGLRNLIVAHSLLGHRALVRDLVRRHREWYPDSRFERQLSHLAL